MVFKCTPLCIFVSIIFTRNQRNQVLEVLETSFQDQSLRRGFSECQFQDRVRDWNLSSLNIKTWWDQNFWVWILRLSLRLEVPVSQLWGDGSFVSFLFSEVDFRLQEFWLTQPHPTQNRTYHIRINILEGPVPLEQTNFDCLTYRKKLITMNTWEDHERSKGLQIS